MIIVDDRIGSADLGPQLRKLGVDTTIARLEFGDLAFEGKGAENTTVQIGVELKKVPDLLQSLREGRLTGRQLPGMMDETKGLYDYGWLLIEGGITINAKNGEIGIKTAWGKRSTNFGTWTYAELQKRLFTLEQQWDVRTVWCADRAETLRWLVTLYRWWTDRALDGHASALQTHRPMGWLKVSPFREAVMRWPHIGPKLSKTVEDAFDGNLRTAANAGIDQWAALTVGDVRTGTSRRLGMKAASNIVDFLNGKR